jgi:hypothetical protein
MKVFASGSCRLVTAINNGHNKVTPIHSMLQNYAGMNFLGKLHNTKQHIQFIKFIKDEIQIPPRILPQFLTSYNYSIFRNSKKYGYICDNFTSLPIKKASIKRQFDECEWYLFEICSLKLYRNSGFEVQFELMNDKTYMLQTETELLADLHTIRAMIPSNKKILFQTHFRPNIIHNDPSKTIEQREVIYNVVNKFCEETENTFMYDPSILIRQNHSLFDGDVHFTLSGYAESFQYIFNLFLKD